MVTTPDLGHPPSLPEAEGESEDEDKEGEEGNVESKEEGREDIVSEWLVLVLLGIQESEYNAYKRVELDLHECF